MSLKEQITNDMKAAMRAKEAGKLNTIRLLLAEIKRKEVDEQIEVNDQQTVAIVEKMIKQRKDSITQFEAGNRADLAEIEKAELEVMSWTPSLRNWSRILSMASTSPSLIFGSTNVIFGLRVRILTSLAALTRSFVILTNGTSSSSPPFAN